MSIFFTLSSIVLLAAHVYLHIKLRLFFGGGSWQIPVLAFFACMLALLIFRRGDLIERMPDFAICIAFAWLGFAMISTMLFACIDAGRLLLGAAGLLCGKSLSVILNPAFSTPLALVLAIAVWGGGVYSAYHPVIKYNTIVSDRVPTGVERFRIVAVSDVHLGRLIGPGMLAEIVRRINELEPDIFLVAGDLVDMNMSNRAEDAAILRQVSSKHASFAVMGNHEFYNGLDNSRAFMAQSGLIVLENTTREVDFLTIVGLNDTILDKLPGEAAPFSTEDFKNIPPGRFILVLAHRPTVHPENIGRFDLQFSGHTHGGQIWPFSLLAAKINQVAQGMTPLESPSGKSQLYVSNGTGFWGPPVRVLATPEITVFDLFPSQK